jgi:hypothetical protein
LDTGLAILYLTESGYAFSLEITMRITRLLSLLLLIFLFWSTMQLQPSLAADNNPQVGKLPARVYDGPGVVGYKPLGRLAKGTPVVPLAVFVGFTKIQFTDEAGATQVAYVASKLLINVPEGLPQLTINEVPWRKSGGLNIFNKPITAHDYLNPGVMPVKGIVHILLQFAPGSAGSVQFSDRLATGYNVPWWKNRHMVIVGVHDGSYYWGFRDGSTEAGQFGPLGGISDGIVVIALSADRRSVAFLNKDNQTLAAFDASTVGNYPNGFPSRAYIELLVESKSQIVLTQLIWITPPTGIVPF